MKIEIQTYLSYNPQCTILSIEEGRVYIRQVHSYGKGVPPMVREEYRRKGLLLSYKIYTEIHNDYCKNKFQAFFFKVVGHVGMSPREMDEFEATLEKQPYN